jgi:gliding motility-associated-like protein
MAKIFLTFLLSSIIFIAGAQTSCQGPGRAPTLARSVCGSLSITETDVSPCSGPDLASTACADAVSTDNSRWYKFHCYQSGNFGFFITPVNGGDDYDWSVLDITGHAPADVYTTDLIISLNLSAITGVTGCTPTGTLDTHCAGGTAGSQFNRLVNLVAGHDYFLMVTNWSNSTDPYTITFSGTAILTNNTTPSISDVSLMNCDPTKIKITFSEDIRCSSITLTGTELTFSGGQTVLSVASDCQIGATSVPSVIVSLQSPLLPGSNTVTVHDGNDLNTFENVCGIPMAGTTIPFTVPSLVPPVVTSPISYCQNAAAVPLTATGTGLLWYTAAAGGTGDAIAPTPITTTPGSTIYYVTQTTSACETPRSAITVNINPAPAAPVVSPSVPYCQNATAAPLTATGTNLLWYTTATGGIPSTTAPAPITTAPGSTIYYVSQTTGTCESPRAAISVDVTATPAAPGVTTPVVYCEGATAVPLTATFTGDDIWFNIPVGGTGNTNAPTPSTTPTGSTIYYVSQIINGCEGPRSAITVNVVAAPSAPTVTSPVSYCQNATAAVLTATGSNLLWYTTATGGTGSPTAIVPNTTTAGTTIYYVSQTTGTCESPRAAITVDITATPTATVSTTATSCPGVDNGSITATPAGTGTYTYTIDAIPANTSGAATGTFTQLPAGFYTITFTGGPNSCTGSATGTVAQGTALTSAAAVVNPNCAGTDDGSFTVTPTSGAAPYTYIIDAVPANITGAATGVFTGLAPGSYIITFTDANGCTGTQAKALTSNAPITIPEAHTDVKCFAGTDGTITLTPAGGVAPYTYALLPSTTFQASSTITGLSTGSHTIRVKDNVGCTKDITIIITEPAQLTASAVKDNNATCEGNDGGITVTAAGGTAPYQYSIDNGLTYQPAGVFTNATDATYSGNIKVKDANGCTATANSVTISRDNNLALDILANPDTTICQGSGVKFTPVLTNAGAGTTYSWTSLTPVVPNSTIDSLHSLNATVSPVDSAVYNLTVTYKACTISDNVPVNVIWKPIVNAGPSAVSVCLGDSVLLIGSVTHTSGPIDSLVWTPTDSLTTPVSNQTWAHPVNNTYYHLTAFTSVGVGKYGCVFTPQAYDSIKVVIPAPVIASAGRDTIAVKGQPHQLLGSGGVSYEWSSPTPSVIITSPLSQNPFVTLNNDASFSVIVKNATGCADTASVFVRIMDGPMYYIPNAFSPNGDGMNDVFRAIPAGMANTQYFKVMNRLGEIMFETNQYLKGWDGTFKGKKQPMGVYVWIVKGQDKDGKIVEMKGTVMLVQ